MTHEQQPRTTTPKQIAVAVAIVLASAGGIVTGVLKFTQKPNEVSAKLTLDDLSTLDARYASKDQVQRDRDSLDKRLDRIEDKLDRAILYKSGQRADSSRER